MSSVEEMGDRLAADVIRAQAELDDDTLIKSVSDILEAASSGLHESFMASIRARLAEIRARRYLRDKYSEAGKPPPGAKPSQ